MNNAEHSMRVSGARIIFRPYYWAETLVQWSTATPADLRAGHSTDPICRATVHTLLGEAFQLTNFIRDITEDLQRGRVYLPMEDLRASGVTVESLRAGVVDSPFP